MEGWSQSRRDRQREAASGTPGPQPDALPIKADVYGMTWADEEEAVTHVLPGMPRPLALLSPSIKVQ